MITILLLLLALISFTIAAFRLANNLRIDFIALGLMFLTLGWLLPVIGIH
jgi:hypothetical protein